MCLANQKLFPSSMPPGDLSRYVTRTSFIPDQKQTQRTSQNKKNPPTGLQVKTTHVQRPLMVLHTKMSVCCMSEDNNVVLTQRRFCRGHIYLNKLRNIYVGRVA